MELCLSVLLIPCKVAFEPFFQLLNSLVQTVELCITNVFDALYFREKMTRPIRDIINVSNTARRYSCTLNLWICLLELI